LRASSKLPDINGGDQYIKTEYDDLIDGNAPIKSSTRGSSKGTVAAPFQRQESVMKIGGDELSSVNMIDEDEPIGGKRAR
jgi:hypothetical protein|tara:strand:- start:336 stop:575 length:240 start_codon:yes stop_codon:yes gene_type:complete